VDGSLTWAVDVKLPGMVHARNVKPPFACARLTGIDESSVKTVPGFIKVVSKGNYVAVVCEREEQAIRAARQLKTTWEKPATAPFPSSENLFDYMRTAPAAEPSGAGDAETRNAAPQPRQPAIRMRHSPARQRRSKRNTTSHSGPHRVRRRHATADPSNGQMTVYSNDMKTYGCARDRDVPGMPPEQVRVIWMHGPQGFGRTAAEDAGCEAAWIAREIGRPVRMQWMRDEETAWDTKSPAFLVKMRGALDCDGRLMAYDYKARSCDYNHLGYNEPDTMLIAQLMGSRRARPAGGSASMPSDMYVIPNRKMAERSSACRSSGRRRSAPVTCAIRTARRRRSPPNRSSTKRRRRRKPIRCNSGCR
jgi:CO/xanthine dehydrogenase Mo-binding subunit